jgi:hypothetical protein
MVSSFILESDDLDEIDWEWLGSNDASVEVISSAKAIPQPITVPFTTLSLTPLEHGTHTLLIGRPRTSNGTSTPTSSAHSSTPTPSL